MASLQLYRRRIKSINSTRQITKAMELVAASKMRRAQEQTSRLSDYASTTEEFVRILSSITDPVAHPLLYRPAESGNNKKLMVTITSDRGLAGVYNSALLRKVIEVETKDSTHMTNYLTIGKKGQDFLNRLAKTIVASFTKFPPHPSIADIQPIVKIISDGFLSRQYSSVHIAYTKYISTIKLEPQVFQLLPIEPPPSLTELNIAPRGRAEYKFEPTRDEVLEFILPRALETVIYRTILESIASEHSARMIAMKNASDNAKDLIDDLTLTYNSVRQAKITQELSEIATAAGAVT